MPTLSVLLLCANAYRVERFTALFARLDFVRLQVVTHESDWSEPLCGQEGPDLVVCDSLPARGGIGYLRRLCEHSGFFSVIECEALAAPIRWGLNHFRVQAGKYFVGSYDALAAAQIDGLLFKALTVKRTVRRHNLGSLPRSSREVMNDWREALDIDQALDQQQIVAFYQPQVCLRSGRICGIEVLARWRHPQKGVLGPQAFLDLIDTPQRHARLLDCLLLQGLKLQRHLQLSASGEWLVFSYNIEPSQLDEEGFASRTLRHIEQAGVPCSQVMLEVTERDPLALNLNSIENISQLVKSGVGLALDDFGTGHSTLARLARIPFAQVKLDAGFVAHVNSLRETRVVEALVGLAQTMGFELIAEGIETEKQRLHLQRLGVDVGQGFLMYKPMSCNDLLEVLVTSLAILRLG